VEAPGRSLDAVDGPPGTAHGEELEMPTVRGDKRHLKKEKKKPKKDIKQRRKEKREKRTQERSGFLP
jgi:hypothetical protein